MIASFSELPFLYVLKEKNKDMVNFFSDYPHVYPFDDDGIDHCGPCPEGPDWAQSEPYCVCWAKRNCAWLWDGGAWKEVE